MSKHPLILLQTPQIVGANSQHAWVAWTTMEVGEL